MIEFETGDRVGTPLGAGGVLKKELAEDAKVTGRYVVKLDNPEKWVCSAFGSTPCFWVDELTHIGA